ncbi:MAG: ATP-binding protein [Spirochaetales bacterium]|uniref:histidine kinase n=1 Tax=Candidatus Thalassospirochaeta sargassi TaxID=3119039 RepID=A0AAJ1MJF8_9SPIO|nr:ATP-binding protein [Spirochaetales bacterium]
MKTRPLFGGTFIILITMVVIAIAPITIFNIQGFKDFFYSETEIYLIESCSLIKNLFPAYNSEDSSELESFADHAADSTRLRVTIIDDSGLVLSDSHNIITEMNNHADRPEVVSAMRDGIGTSVRNSATMANEMMYAAVRVDFRDSSKGTIRLARSLADIEERISRITRNTLLAGFIALALAAWVSFLVAGHVSLLIKKIKVTSRFYASGDFSEQLMISHPEEIAELADDLNEMGDQLKERIEMIEEQKNELQLILDNMTEPVLYTDKDLHLLRINGAAEKLFNIQEENHKGKSILEVFMNSELNSFAEMLVRERLSKETIINLDLPKTFHLEIHGTVLFDNSGDNVIALLLVMHDITKTRKLEEMRKDFVANVSHELKTPVTMIKGYVETLLDSPERDPAKTDEFLQIIERHSLRVEAIINDLLFLSGIEKNDSDSLALEDIPAIDLITSAVTSCEPNAEDKDIKINIECDENIMMNVYPLLAEQAVINLVDNAVKYSGKGTEIFVRVKPGENGKTCLTVRDQGCGITAGQQERIFERFYRVDKARSRESGGTGLGLSIVKHIALTHNGSINLKSTPGEGSEFTLCI